ncbi:MAG: ROK family protein [Eggerthellaceae bacterium]|nr:ROK family protein [Eggerthellaceae bacterium]
MNEDKLFLGIDYGGNAVKAGLIDSYGNLVGKTSWPTVDLVDKVACRAFATKLGEFVHGLGYYSSELGGVGLAMPGMIAQDSYFFPNINVDMPLMLDYISKAFSKINVAVLNDANAAALGEMWMGAGGNAHSALLVTLGSGIGSGLIVDGNVVSGAHGAAGEIGHMTVVPGGRDCMCGRKGCVERYSSARGIVQSFKEAGGADGVDTAAFSTYEPKNDTDAYTVFKAYEQGDPRAKVALADMADKLGFALAQMACVVDPDLIMLGGGIAHSAELFIDDLRAAFGKYCLAWCAGTEIRTANLSNDAGIFGAARYAMVQRPRDDSHRDWLDPDFGL